VLKSKKFLDLSKALIKRKKSEWLQTRYSTCVILSWKGGVQRRHQAMVDNRKWRDPRSSSYPCYWIPTPAFHFARVERWTHRRSHSHVWVLSKSTHDMKTVNSQKKKKRHGKPGENSTSGDTPPRSSTFYSSSVPFGTRITDNIYKKILEKLEVKSAYMS